MSMNAAVVEALEEAAVEEREVRRVIRRLMAHYGITGSELAEAFGMSRQSMSHRLTGRTAFQTAELKALARFFGVPTEVLRSTSDGALLWILQHPDDRPEWLSGQEIRSRGWSSLFAGYGRDPQSSVLSVA